jgi:putative FmdB family regulatory protein
MPLYEYECQDHGVFELLRALSEYAAPAACPACAVPASRVVSIPQLACLSRATRTAIDRNEQSRHEPRLVRGCADPAHPAHPVSKQAARPKLQRSTGSRPWVIEHG